MTPTAEYSSNERCFFADLGRRPIGGGIALWHRFFQTLRPDIGRMLGNVDISTGAMYRAGKLIDLALEFLGEHGRPNALAPNCGLPDRERLRLQQFILGIKVNTPYRAQVPHRRRRVKILTRESARDLTFDIGDRKTMSVADYFQGQLNIPLQFPDVICVAVCTIPISSFFVFSQHVALERCSNPVRALRSPNWSARP